MRSGRQVGVFEPLVGRARARAWIIQPRVAGIVGAFATMSWACAGAVRPQATPCPPVDGPLSFAFYAFFEPVSYSASTDSGSPGFREHMGYEAELLSALEEMPGSPSFARQPIAEWPGVWLLPRTPEFDVAGGGITILDSRTRDETGEPVVAFTSGHIAFRQSLLVRIEDAERLSAYDQLTNDIRVGVLPGTTGETRLLEVTGFVDDAGVLRQGTRVETLAGPVVADGTVSFTITAAFVSPRLQARLRLVPPAVAMPEVVYLGRETGEGELLRSLENGSIDAVARGEIGNGEAARASGGAFVVSVRDSLAEYGGFTVNAANRDLLACLNERIDWLTDHRRIGYSEWRADPSVFRRRAVNWRDE